MRRENAFVFLSVVLVVCLITLVVPVVSNAAMLSIEPEDSSVSLGNEIDLAVKISGVSNLFGVSFDINYDGDILEYVRAELGNFMGSDLVFLPIGGNNTVSIPISMKLGQIPVSGSGTIATVTFRGKSVGTSQMSFRQDTLTVQNGDGASIPITAKDAMVTVTDGDQEEVKILSLPELTAEPGETLSVFMDIEDISGVSGADISVTYDSSMLEVTDVRATELSWGMNLVPNMDTPGELILAMAGQEPSAGGSGALAEIVSVVSLDVEDGTEIPLEFKEAYLYDEAGVPMPVESYDGKITVTVEVSCTKGDVNDDGDIRANDALLALRIAARKMIPTPQQRCAADVNDDDMIKSNDAIIILRMATGIGAPSLVNHAANISVPICIALFEAYGVAGQNVSVPIAIDNSSMLASGDICVAYDPSILRAIDVSSSDNDMLLESNVSEPGLVRIAFAKPDGLCGETLARIQFDILTDSISPLTFESVELYQPDALPIELRRIDGKFTSWAVPPEHTALLQNFPNPFNPDTWIPYQLKEGSEVTVQIFSIAGSIVRELKLGYKSAGVYTSKERAAYWDGRNEAGEQVASGIYFYIIQAGEFTATKRMVVAQ